MKNAPRSNSADEERPDVQIDAYYLWDGRGVPVWNIIRVPPQYLAKRNESSYRVYGMINSTKESVAGGPPGMQDELLLCNCGGSDGMIGM